MQLYAYFQGRKLLPLSTGAGLTPLSLAIINGQTNIVEEYFQHRVAKKSIYFQSDVIKVKNISIHPISVKKNFFDNFRKVQLHFKKHTFVNKNSNLALGKYASSFMFKCFYSGY